MPVCFLYIYTDGLLHSNGGCSVKKIRASRNTSRSAKRDASVATGHLHTILSTIDGAGRANDPGHSKMLTNVEGITQNNTPKSVSVTGTNKIITNQAKAFKHMLMIFIVTIVFITCGIHICLMNMGVYISAAVRRSMITNSVVNPFIYGIYSALFSGKTCDIYTVREAAFLLPLIIHPYVHSGPNVPLNTTKRLLHDRTIGQLIHNVFLKINSLDEWDDGLKQNSEFDPQPICEMFLSLLDNLLKLSIFNENVLTLFNISVYVYITVKINNLFMTFLS